ncbi:MAG: site-specific integrase, partial [Clostridia bacterium]|nr:site-specific integrase [Clostridia bacterium]
FFELLFYSGARKGEISALTTSDVEKRGDVYAIKISKNASRRHDGKGIMVTPPKTYASNRTVTLPECLTKELGEYLEGKEGYLFGGNAPADTTSYSLAFASAIKKTGVTRIRMHDLRHSHASILIAAGVPVTSVSKRLGHSTPKTTLDVYSHCLEKGEEEVLSVLNGLPVKKK